MANCSKMAKLSSAAFEDMPDEVVLQIFKHLEFHDNASSSQVCKRWKLLSEDQSLWQKINLHGMEVPAKFIEKALRHGCQYLGLKGIKIENVLGIHLVKPSDDEIDAFLLRFYTFVAFFFFFKPLYSFLS